MNGSLIVLAWYGTLLVQKQANIEEFDNQNILANMAKGSRKKKFFFLVARPLRRGGG